MSSLQELIDQVKQRREKDQGGLDVSISAECTSIKRRSMSKEIHAKGKSSKGKLSKVNPSKVNPYKQKQSMPSPIKSSGKSRKEAGKLTATPKALAWSSLPQDAWEPYL